MIKETNLEAFANRFSEYTPSKPLSFMTLACI